MDSDRRIRIFEDELNLIEDDYIREETIQALKQVPDTFFTKPASSSGNHHPKPMRYKYGLILHTKKAVALLNQLLESKEVLQPVKKDEAISAMILHDTYKYGEGENKEHTISNHASLAAEKLEKTTQLPETTIECIKRHMGPYGEHPPTQSLHKLVYYADDMSTNPEIKAILQPGDQEIRNELRNIHGAN